MPDADAGHDAGGLADLGVCGSALELCERGPLGSEIPLTGSPGWRDSVGELCNPVQAQLDGVGIVSTSDGVAVLAETHWYGEDSTVANLGYAVQWNRGTGWQTQISTVDTYWNNGMRLFAGPMDSLWVTGLVGFNSNFSTFGCWFARVADGAVAECIAAPSGYTASVGATVTTPSGSLYLLAGDRVGRLDGAAVTTMFSFDTTGFGTADLWTDGETSVVVGSRESVLVHTASTGVRMLDAVPAGNFTVVAGRSANELVIGTDAGTLLRFDDTTFTSVPLPTQSCATADRVVDLFVTSTGAVYYATQHSYGVMHPGALPVDLVSWACDANLQIVGLAGNEARGERYLAIRRPTDLFTTCGDVRAVVHSAAGFSLF